MNNKKICWLTPDCFADCDIDIVPALCKQGWNIHWIILFNLNDNRFSEADFDAIVKDCKGRLTMEFVRLTYRKRYPQNALVYWSLANKVRQQKADVNYINMIPGTPWELAFFYHLTKKNTIISAHQGRVHLGMGHFRYYNFLRDRVYGRLKNVNMFSKSQASYFKERYADSRIFQIPLGLKYFGESTQERPSATECVKLLIFGLIVRNKNLPIVVDAVNNLYEKGIRDIKVIIRGKGVAVEEVKTHIKYPEIIDAEFRYVDNAEIPDLFNTSHYLVQPYKEMSQSGPFKVAMQYNLPLITSDLEGFTDEMKVGDTGFVFKNDNVKDLEEVIMKCYDIAKKEEEYASLRKRMANFVNTKYSVDSIVRLYADMFNSIAKS